MSIFRPPASPQAIQVGLALFLTGASGPVVPAGDPAQSSQSQTVVAYRSAASLAAQPTRASIVAMLPAAAAVAQAQPALAPSQPWPHAAVTKAGATVAAALFGTAAAYLQATPALCVAQAMWPYAATMLDVPSASQWGIADSDLIFDRLQPALPQQAPAWPYPATMATKVSASIFGVVSAYLRSPTISVMPAQVWPHASTQPAEPLPIITAAVQVAFAPTLPLPSGAWPYLLSMPSQTASQWSIPPAALVFDRLQPAIVPAVRWPYLSVFSVGTAPIAPAVAQVAPAQVALPAATRWPYSYTMLGAQSASQWSIPPAALIFDRLQPPIPQQAPWPYLTTQPVDATPITTVAAQVPPGVEPQLPPVQAWPYVASMLDAPSASQWSIPPAALVFDRLMPTIVPAQAWSYAVAIGLGTDIVSVPVLGPQIPPSPVLQWLAQPLYPYAATFAAPALALPIAQAQAQVPPGVAAQIAPQPWTYLLASPAAGLVATAPVSAPVLAPQSPQQATPQAWPCVIKARDFANVIALIGPQAPPQPVQQWVTQPPWSYSVVATLYPGPATLLAPPFVVGNTEVWHVEPRPRDWAVEPRPRFWAVQDH